MSTTPSPSLTLAQTSPSSGQPDTPEAEAPHERAVILVVDDEARNRSLMRALLSRDHTVLEASAGPEALDICARQSIDLVILDVMMPGMTGFEVCKRLKARTSDELLPVLLVTALSDANNRHTGLEAGADDFLSKPVDRQELFLRVNHFLRLRRQHRMLTKQYQALQELVALKDDLVTLMVHDLRNPLTGVLGLLQIIEQETTDPVKHSDAQNARQAAEKLRDTLDDLLQVRLLEEGRLAVNRQPTPIAEVIESAVESVSGAARMNDLQVLTSLEPDLVGSVDATLLRRALENLISNAIKFSPHGQAIEVQAAGGPSGELQIRVVDHGKGVPAEKKVELFQKFGGLTVRRASDRRGFGLGLYLVRLVAEAHEGRVSVADREGGGTILTLTLPGAIVAHPAV